MKKKHTFAKPGHQPFFMDVTLRDGNQALKKPWSLDQKIEVFEVLSGLGVQGVEAGFASASESDFLACREISRIASEDMIISSLSRANKREIEISWDAIRFARKPRIHIVFPVSPFAIEYVLEKSEKEAIAMVTSAVAFARQISQDNKNATIQFSGEHLGECASPDGFQLSTAKKIFAAAIEAGATIINLPNTVERFRPSLFANMVAQLKKFFPPDIVISVHNHNDLGMAVATTVESFFSGASQLETTINGLGERAGNTSMIETAISLKNCGVNVSLNFNKMYDASQKIATISGVEIHEKAPIVGSDITAHRSGIHQDGVRKTSGQGRGLYRPFEFREIGRPDSDVICFTSQSGKSAIVEILHSIGVYISDDEARVLQPTLKEISEKGCGQLMPEEIAAMLVELRRR